MSAKKRKADSLGEKLSSLIHTTPKVFESDDEGDFTTPAKLTTYDRDSDLSADELDVTKFRKLNAKFLEEEDSKYLGKGISRKDLAAFDSDLSETNSLPQTDSDDDDLVSNDNVDEEYEDEDEIEDESEDEDVEGEEESSEEEEETDKTEEIQSLSKKFKNDKSSILDKSEEVDFNREIISRAAKDVEKGRAIKSQLLLWDFFLDCRLKFQACLTASNQFPNYKNFPKFKGNLEFDNSVTETKKSLKHLLKLLLSLQEVFLCSNQEFISSVQNTMKSAESDDEEINSDFEIDNDVDTNRNNIKNLNLFNNHLKKLNDFSSEISKRHKIIEKYKNTTIQKWDDKTRLGSISSKNFSAFEQTALKQIEQILVDKQRLITRTQTKRSDYHILCSEDESRPPKKQIKVENSDSESVSLSKKKFVIVKEIFDDDDFYHQLLSELIRRKASGIVDPIQLGRQWMQLQKIRSKMKKTVDTKASKARKVRFVVHPKLVNFMMPTSVISDNDNARIELINSLFGRKK